MANSLSAAFASLLCASVLLPVLAGAQVRSEIKRVTFLPSTEDFPNPERGFHRYREMTAQNDFDIRKDNNTLIFLKLRADAFRAGPLSADFLARFQGACDQARAAGVKLIPRVAYNDGPEAGCPAQYGCDAPKAIVMGHIAQLAPLWKKNKDIINILDPGFIGGWGEWHTSSNHLDNKQDMTDILYAILDSLPADRMVYVRYPRIKRDIFAGNPVSDAQQLTQARAFDGSRNSRVGHLNDCYLSGDDDVGTYKDIANGWPRSRETSFIGAESQFTPMGGETCAVHEMGTCANTLKEMAIMHIDNLNRDFHADVIQRWKDQGCYDTIARRLGYRIALDSALLPDTVGPGGGLSFYVMLRNLGFGELFNPRTVEITLEGPGTAGGPLSALLPGRDPRYWTGGKEVTFGDDLSIPMSLAEGTYTLGVRLADKDSVLAKDPRYSIRFANQGTWDAAKGINVLKKDLVVSRKAIDAGRFPFFTRFEAVGTPESVRAPSAPAKTGSGKAASRPMSAMPGILEVGNDAYDARGRTQP